MPHLDDPGYIIRYQRLVDLGVMTNDASFWFAVVQVMSFADAGVVGRQLAVAHGLRLQYHWNLFHPAPDGVCKLLP